MDFGAQLSQAVIFQEDSSGSNAGSCFDGRVITTLTV